MSYSVESLGTEHKKALDSVVQRATRDKAYRERLKKNPASAIKEETGISVPKGFDIRFIENEADMTIVLPDAQRAEISEKDLESVAGGGSWICGVDDVCGVDAAAPKSN